MKTAVAAVCVVAAGMGGLKAYNVSNQAKVDTLLAENVEALSQNDDDPSIPRACIISMEEYKDSYGAKFCPFSAPYRICCHVQVTVGDIHGHMIKRDVWCPEKTNDPQKASKERF